LLKDSSIKIYQVDAFTSEPFKGNPAAVCLLNGPRGNAQIDDEWMQSLAMEMNLSETAFVTQRTPNRFMIRWMTPEVEVDLCGHATLASAHILFEEGFADRSKPISFSSRSGALSAAIVEDGKGITSIELNFPAIEEQKVEAPPEDIIRAIPSDILYIGKGAFDYLIELPSEAAVRSLDPDFELMKLASVRGIIVTARADEGMKYDFVSRGFFPGAGIPEDPVTGSAHCMLGPYWMQRLHKTFLTGFQASKRGGYVRVAVEGDRVRLYGNAVTILKGELSV
jgi:PhzF family phenazine biosynthesis protein